MTAGTDEEIGILGKSSVSSSSFMVNDTLERVSISRLIEAIIDSDMLSSLQHCSWREKKILLL